MGASGGTAKTIGWREWVRLPELDDAPIKAKVDTGARSSALHTHQQQPFEHNGKPWIRFWLDDERDAVCEAPILDQRRVRNSGGQQEMRFTILTSVELGNDRWPIELTLTNRSRMGFPMLLGRTAVTRRFLVDAGASFVQSKALQQQLRPRVTGETPQ